MSSPLNLSNPQRPVHVGVILMNGVTEILDVAPIDFFSGLGQVFANEFPDEIVSPKVKAQAIDFRFHWVSESGPAKPMKLTSGITLEPTDSFESAPPLDIVLIGAHNIGYHPSEVELEYVRKAWGECTAFLTICGGVEVPRLAGLLDGKTATGPRFLLPLLRQQSPKTNWVEKRYVSDGKLWTSGALLNGTDMLAAFAQEIWGKHQTGEEGSLVGMITNMGAWPARDIDYRDVVGPL
ncbi:unnamed protein product [Clonostachys rosea f. rosea IK726]|uniref:DJ-1/PfpI domain-containing protein n=2 Tax=Bionectria ochroleuca TaxID=29856 RepID=A0A8H7TSE0_BIOOC|nr:unnamed protein product [Clonostachys rosea f. rosea IK726]